MKEIFLEVQDLKKSFMTKKGEIKVLKGIDLKVEKSEIYGIIGFSGAGKSTLVRCINRLEEPSDGKIILEGIDITNLNKKDLNEKRKKIGMIFQTFNLFESKTIFQNIEYPLKSNIKDKIARKKRVLELIDLVGLSDKVYDYPAQLSGGQKQRVGIARALANNPNVLLSDEATSALDPQTTLSVLDLLKDINKKLGITIIMISHEIEVIKYMCNSVAIIEDGSIKEKGKVEDVFTNPQSETGRIFISVDKRLKEEWSRRERKSYDISNSFAY